MRYTDYLYDITIVPCKEPETVRVQKTIFETGFKEAGIIPAAQLTFHEEVRKMCEGNQCGCYGTTWACPPAVGSLEECRERIRQFSCMYLFSKFYVLEDSFDLDGMRRADIRMI